MTCTLTLLKTFTFLTGFFRIYNHIYVDSDHHLQAVKLTYDFNDHRHQFIFYSNDSYLPCFPSSSRDRTAYRLMDPSAFPYPKRVYTPFDFSEYADHREPCQVDFHYHIYENKNCSEMDDLLYWESPTAKPTRKPIRPTPNLVPVYFPTPTSLHSHPPTPSHPLTPTPTPTSTHKHTTFPPTPPSSSSPEAIPLDDRIEYLGCIKSPQHVHHIAVWPHSVTTYYDDTNLALIDACMNACQDLSPANRYIGMDSGTQCICGRQPPMIEDKKHACSPCVDTPQYTCGNVNYGFTSVYKVLRKIETRL